MFGLVRKKELNKALSEIKELERRNKVLECKVEWRDKVIKSRDNIIERVNSQVENRNIFIKDLKKEIDLLDKSFKEIK